MGESVNLVRSLVTSAAQRQAQAQAAAQVPTVTTDYDIPTTRVAVMRDARDADAYTVEATTAPPDTTTNYHDGSFLAGYSGYGLLVLGVSLGCTVASCSDRCLWVILTNMYAYATQAGQPDNLQSTLQRSHGVRGPGAPSLQSVSTSYLRIVTAIFAFDRTGGPEVAQSERFYSTTTQLLLQQVASFRA